MSLRLHLCTLPKTLFCMLFVGMLPVCILLAASAARATTTFPFSFADSPEQDIVFDGGDTYSEFRFMITGGSGNTGLQPGVSRTIHVGASTLSSLAEGTSIQEQGVISRQITIGGITQTLTQNDSFGQGPNGEYTTVDVQAGPTLTFDEGTQGRVDVTPQEYTYDTRNGAAPKYAYTILLRPAAVPVAGVSVSPSSVTYPASATGTVTLTKPAADAETVVLTSSNPAAASVPATLTFTAGHQTATFPITTFRVDSDTSLTISAAAGGTTKTAAFTVRTRPTISFSYSIAGLSNMAYTEGDDNSSSLTFGITGGSGTMKLPMGYPTTLTVGQYYHSFSIDPSYGFFTIDPTPVSHGCTIGGSTQSFSQTLNGRGYDYGFGDTGNEASLSGSQTLVYDFGSKGLLEVTSPGFDYYYIDDGTEVASDTSPAQYTFLLLAPDTLSSLLVSPAKVYGGAITYGKVTLDAVAPAGGQVVTLATSDASVAAVPSSVTVPADVKSAVFEIATAATDEDTPVTLTAVSKGVIKTASLTVLARYGFSGTVKNGSSGLGGVTVNAASTGTFTLTSTAAPSTAIPDNSTAGLTSTLVPKGAGTITGLVVGVDITHPNIADLRLTLKGPDGTTAILYDQSGGTQQNIVGSYPVLRTPVGSLSAFNGKQVAGTWTLLVQDLAAGNTGTFNLWNLTFTYQGTYTGSGTTASNGTYTVSDLKEGTYTATPVKSGTSFTPSSRSVTVGPSVVDPNPGGIDFAKH